MLCPGRWVIVSFPFSIRSHRGGCDTDTVAFPRIRTVSLVQLSCTPRREHCVHGIDLSHLTLRRRQLVQLFGALCVLRRVWVGFSPGLGVLSLSGEIWGISISVSWFSRCQGSNQWVISWGSLARRNLQGLRKEYFLSTAEDSIYGQNWPRLPLYSRDQSSATICL